MCVYVYSAYVQDSFTAATDVLAIEIDAPANTTVKIRKILINHGDGTQTNGTGVPDYHRKIKIITESAGGTGGTSYTPVKLDQNAPAAQSTVKTKLSALGTTDATFDINSQHTSNSFVWQAVDEDDKIVIKAGNFFGVVINTAA